MSLKSLLNNFRGLLINKPRDLLKFLYHLPKNIPIYIQNSKNYWLNYQHRLANLSATNLELGLYHLKSNNINDAIFRFK